MPTWLIRYLPHMIVLAILATGALWLRHWGYTDGLAEGLSQGDAKAERAQAFTAAAQRQSEQWRLALVDLQASLDAEAKRRAEVEAQGQAAVVAAQAQAAEADRTLATWMERYGNALRGACRRQMEEPLCGDLTGF